MCRLPRNLGSFNLLEPQGLSRPVMELLYLLRIPLYREILEYFQNKGRPGGASVPRDRVYHLWLRGFTKQLSRPVIGLLYLWHVLLYREILEYFQNKERPGGASVPRDGVYHLWRRGFTLISQSASYHNKVRRELKYLCRVLRFRCDRRTWPCGGGWWVGGGCSVCTICDYLTRLIAAIKLLMTRPHSPLITHHIPS
jgi:hypothetical protein